MLLGAPGCSLGAPGMFLEFGMLLGFTRGSRGAPGVFVECSSGVSGVLLGGSLWVFLGCTWVAPGVFLGAVFKVFLKALEGKKRRRLRHHFRNG